MKKQEEGIELYLNQKKVKKGKRMLFHQEVKISFEGKAILINENKKETDFNYQIELSNHYILNRSGNYQIIYIDSKGKQHNFYFSIRKKVPIFVFFVLFLPILLFGVFYQEGFKNKAIEKELQVAVSQEDLSITNYVFHLYFQQDSKSKTIHLVDTMQGKEKINQKIAPGTKGEFRICMDTYQSTEALVYEIQVKDKTKKPENLYFKSQTDKEYQSLEELAARELQGKINKNSEKTIPIKWEWKYEISDEKNQIDVQDATEIASYQFQVLAIGKQI